MRAHYPVFDRVIKKCRDLDPIPCAGSMPERRRGGQLSQREFLDDELQDFALTEPKGTVGAPSEKSLPASIRRDKAIIHSEE
jgi:hypothetical protein